MLLNMGNDFLCWKMIFYSGKRCFIGETDFGGWSLLDSSYLQKRDKDANSAKMTNEFLGEKIFILFWKQNVGPFWLAEVHLVGPFWFVIWGVPSGLSYFGFYFLISTLAWFCRSLILSLSYRYYPCRVFQSSLRRPGDRYFKKGQKMVVSLY